MTPTLFVKTILNLAGGAALFVILGAATCEGSALVERDPVLDAGICNVLIQFDAAPPGERGETLQLANANNVNDFIQCQVASVREATTQLTIDVSDQDAEGHSFVADRNGQGGSPAIVVNLSR